MATTGDSGVKTNLVVVHVTVPDAKTGKTIAHGLVKEGLAACVNLIPGLTSVYVWEGSVQEDTEQLLMIKTQSTLVEQLTTKVKEMHPYDVFEVIAVPITDGSKAYLDWVNENTKTD